MYIQTAQLTKQYGDVRALDACTLGAENGEVFGLLGPNGAGKTTLLRILLGFLRPTSGRATIDTLDCHRESLRVRERVSYLSGDVRFTRRLRGREVLRYFAHLRPQKNVRRAEQLADRLQLDTSRRVGKMSTGMRQKLALAVVLSADVPLLILDEPTSNLDPTVRSEIVTLLREAKDEGRTVLFSSHVLSEVEEVCDRIAILRKGRHVHTQAISDLRKRHRVRARVTGELTEPPEAIRGQLSVRKEDENVVIDVTGDLSPLFGWFATLPIAEVRIEPIGLKSVYEKFHPEI